MNLIANQAKQRIAKEKYVVAERFIRTVINKIYKYMTSISKMSILLDDIVNKYNNTYHGSIKMKLVDGKSKSLDVKLVII